MNAIEGFSSLAALIAVKTTVLLLIAFAASFLVRNHSASARHVLWALTFVFLLLLPGAAYLSSVRQEVRIPIALLSSGRAMPETTPALREGALSLRALRAGNESVPAPRIADSSAISNPGFQLAGMLWAGGTLLLAARLGLGLLSSLRVRAESDPVRESAWVELLDGARRRLDVRQSVSLRRSDRVRLPMTFGLFRPAILLPAVADDYSMSRRSAVILHELAHVRRRDCGSQLVSQLAAAAFWWNPLVWVAARHMRLLSERASDDLALEAGARPADYARDLLEMARGLHQERETPLGSVAMAHRSRFEDRLLAILNPRIARQSVSSRLVLAAGLGASPLVLSLALAVPTSATPAARAAVSPVETPAPPQEPQPAREPQPPQEPQERKEPRAPRAAPDPAAREAAKRALADALDNPEASVREEALQALVLVGDESLAPYLEKALSDESPRARAQAAWGLGYLRREASAASLVAALRDEDEEVRAQAAWSLGMIGVASSVEGLVSVLSDSSPEVRSQAAWALGMIRDPKAVEALAHALKDVDPEVREQAAWALGLFMRAGDEDPEDPEGVESDARDPNPDPGDVSDTGTRPPPHGASF